MVGPPFVKKRATAFLFIKNMPSPIGHSIISLGIYYFSKTKINKIFLEWKNLIFVLIAGNLPDIDFIPGLLKGELNKYHETYTHTLVFAVIVSFFVWVVLFFFKYKKAYKIAFFSFVLIYAHIIFDIFNFDSRPPIGVMLFWPFTEQYFYLKMPLIYPFDRQNLENLFSKDGLFALFTEILVSVPILVLGIVSVKKKKLKKMIIFGLLLIISAYIFSNITIYKEDAIANEYDFRQKLRGRIVFNSNRKRGNQIYIINADGSNLKRLTKKDGENFSPSWSPSGKYIAFVSTRDGNKEIYIMNKKGGSRLRLTSSDADDTAPVWMPDGRRILFVSNRDGTENFYTVDIKNKEIKKITQFSKGVCGDPSISAKGDKIIYISNVWMSWQIYSYDIATKNIKRLTGPPNGSCNPCISKDGGKILYVSRLGRGNSDIWIMDSNGNNKKQLVSHHALEYSPKFSPDNKYVVFKSNRDENWKLYILEIESNKIIRLTDDKGNDENPDWS